MVLALAVLAYPCVAQADSIFMPGAAAVRTMFDATIERLVGDIPNPGTPIAGTLIYDVEPVAYCKGQGIARTSHGG